MDEAGIIARVERERQDRRVEALLQALRDLAVHGGEDRPTDSISREDAATCYNRQEAWHDGHSAGIDTGRWLAGCDAQAALDEWERNA